MKVILDNKTAEIVEKKSRFIANIFYVASVKEAEERLLEIKKKYYDAKHNCFAYVVGIDGDIVKSSDDGEPQRTAGHPMLDILKGNEITNCIAIVTRYFGGTLLGTGGLVRAYSDSLKSAIKLTQMAIIKHAFEINFDLSYDDYGKVEKLIQNINNSNPSYDNIEKTNMSIYSLDKTFEDVVKLRYLVNENVYDKFKSDLINISKGRVALDNNMRITYYISDNKVKYID